jgi:hypothetical protein
MEDRILINPDNRMLGNSGSNDFSLYGAPADPLLTIGAANSARFSDNPAPAASADSASGDPIAPNAAALEDQAGPSLAPLADASSSAPIAAPAPAIATPGAVEPAVSGGSLIPAPAPAPAATVMALDDTALAAPVLALPPPATNPAFEPVEVAPLEAAPVAAAGVTDAQPEPLPQTALPSDVLTEGPQAALAGLTAGIAPAEALSPALDGVEDLLGTDPAGGIATLVSLVSVSDVFDVSEAGSDIVQVAGPVDLLDTLASDVPDLAPPAVDDEAEPAETLLGSVADPLGGLDDPLEGF